MAKKKKKRALSPEFLVFVEEYNEWRQQFGYPIMVPTDGLCGMYFQAKRSADAHEESWPTWDELTAGAKQGPIGTGYSLQTAGGLLAPKGEGADKTILKMARWGRAVQEVVPDIDPLFLASGESL